MPSTSKKQHNFMNAIAHSPKFAAKAGVPTKVGKDFVAADKKQLKFSEGGDMKSSMKSSMKSPTKSPKVKAMKSILSSVTNGGKKKVNPLAALGGAGGSGLAGIAGGMPIGMKRGGSTCSMMKRGGTVKKAKGGGIEKQGKTKGKIFKRGGHVKARA